MKPTILIPALLALSAACASADTIYSSIPIPLLPNLPSEAYEATGTTQFGGLIQFAGSGESYTLSSVTVVMSDWALAADYGSTAPGFNVPLTLDIYSVGAGDTVGSLLGWETVNAFIPWRPPSAGCDDPTAWRASDGICYHGLASTVSFDLTGVQVPDQVIYGLALNTQHYGTSPIGHPGPYNSLNFGLATTAPSVGSNPLPGTAYVSANAGAFEQEQNWAPYSGAIEFNDTAPEPLTLLLTGAGRLGLGALRRRRARP
jgi:hypothetical protein